jgi:hypothetical protein
MASEPFDYLWIVCPNGLGHATRSVAIATTVAQLAPAHRIAIRSSARAMKRLADAVGVARDHGITFIDDGSDALGNWTGAAAPPAINGWLEGLPRDAALVRDARVVISDNVAAPLAQRPDAVLAGSFLWSDELADRAEPGIVRFVADERALLAAHRPSMLCVADIAMPSLLRETTATPLGWMCGAVDPRDWTEPAPLVAVIGGADTGISDTIAIALKRAGIGIAANFNHSAFAFAQLSLAVVRPGVGALTACITHGVPIVAIAEPGSPEMAHNAARVVAQGFGRAVAAASGLESAVVEAVRIMHTPDVRQRARAAMACARRDGVREAAEWLIARRDRAHP